MAWGGSQLGCAPPPSASAVVELYSLIGGFLKKKGLKKSLKSLRAECGVDLDEQVDGSLEDIYELYTEHKRGGKKRKSQEPPNDQVESEKRAKATDGSVIHVKKVDTATSKLAKKGVVTKAVFIDSDSESSASDDDELDDDKGGVVDDGAKRSAKEVATAEHGQQKGSAGASSDSSDDSDEEKPAGKDRAAVVADQKAERKEITTAATQLTQVGAKASNGDDTKSKKELEAPAEKKKKKKEKQKAMEEVAQGDGDGDEEEKGNDEVKTEKKNKKKKAKKTVVDNIVDDEATKEDEEGDVVDGLATDGDEKKNGEEEEDETQTKLAKASKKKKKNKKKKVEDEVQKAEMDVSEAEQVETPLPEVEPPAMAGRKDDDGEVKTVNGKKRKNKKRSDVEMVDAEKVNEPTTPVRSCAAEDGDGNEEQEEGGEWNTDGSKKQKPGSASRSFQRVKVDEVEFASPELMDNSYWAKGGSGTGWGAKAQEVLGKVKGKNFRHEKTKKKRGSYTGGLIDQQSHSIKFNNSDSD